MLGTEIKLLPPRDPESKGMVERMNGFFRRGFMPGRDFIDPHDFNDQLDAWLPRANARYTRSRHGAPADLVAADRAAMRPLGPIAPDAVFRKEIRLPRDYYVRVHSNDYSVDPSAIGRLVQVTADLATVTVTSGATVLARHERRWARHQIFTDQAHVSRAAELRRDYRSSMARKPPGQAVVQERDLSVYDQAFCITTEIMTEPAELTGALL